MILQADMQQTSGKKDKDFNASDYASEKTCRSKGKSCTTTACMLCFLPTLYHCFMCNTLFIIFRRHCLEFPEGTLEKHYQKILQCDSRLNMLSRNPFPSSNSALFMYSQNTYPDFSGNQSTMTQYPPPLDFRRPIPYPHWQDNNLHSIATRPPVSRNQMSRTPQGTYGSSIFSHSLTVVTPII